MHELYELKDKLMAELEAYNENGKFSKDDAEAIKALSASIEHICNIVDYGEDEEYSSRSYADGMGGSYARGGRGGRGGYSREGGSYRGGSYARGRSGRRDSMGRYSRDDGMEDIETVKAEARKLVEKLEQM